jgi:hypothetical protein
VWIHREKRVAVIANPRTGSRDLGYLVCQSRGFEKFCGHHGVPWGPGYLKEAGPRPMEGDVYWWWSQDHYRWSFYAAHRNHYEVFHSIAHILGLEFATVPRLVTYLWTHAAHYRSSQILFPSFWEIATCQPLRFAHLREDVGAMLDRHHLRPLDDDEFRRDTAQHHTHGKPRGEHFRDVLSPEVIQWIGENYRTEMERFGYEREE